MTKEMVDNIFKYSQDVVKKWKPIMGNLGVNNATILEMLCCFAEYFQIEENNNYQLPNFPGSQLGNGRPSQLGPAINDILVKINKLPNIRVKVVGNHLYYNILSKKLEYKLENDEYITSSEIVTDYTGEVKRSDIISAFPVDFIKLLDSGIYRDMCITSIIS